MTEARTTQVLVEVDATPSVVERRVSQVLVEVDFVPPVPVGKGLDLHWTNYQSAAKNLGIQWEVQSLIANPVGKDLDVRWQIEAYQPVGKTIDIRWTIVGPIGKSVDLRWSVAPPPAPVGRLVTLNWAVELEELGPDEVVSPYIAGA